MKPPPQTAIKPKSNLSGNMMKTTSKQEESTKQTPVKAAQEPPLPPPPRDPPDTTDDKQMKKKSISIDTSAKDAMLITSRKIEMIATPTLAYKIIRIVNHYIKHIIEHYSDDDDINEKAVWYKKWKSVYPIMRSSRRTMIDNYRLLLENDYQTNDDNINTYDFVMALITAIPLLKQSYDIKSIDTKAIDYDKFHLTIVL